MTRLIILCVAWMALSAVIAYLADGAGRKLGKKRLTVFGLRPKHTAVLITTSTGALIALFSFLVLMAASASIREALWRWDQTVAANKFLKSEQERLTGVNRDLTAASQRYQSEAQENLARARKAGQARAAAEGRARKLSGEIAASERQLATTEQNLRERTERLTAMSGQLSNVKSDLAQRREQVQRLDARRKYLERAANILARSNADLSSDNLNLARANQRLGKVNAEIRAGNLAASSDEELVRVVVPPGLSVAEAQVVVTKSLWKAAEIVVERNRAAGRKFPDGKPPVVLSAVRPVLENGRPVLRRFPPARAREDAARSVSVNELSHPGGVVMLVYAKANTIMEESVDVDFRLFKNRLIFEKYDPAKRNWIALTEIDGSRSKESISREVEELLLQVRKEADAHGIMPAADNSIGSLKPEQIADLINDIHSKNTTVPVAAVAQDDTWTAGPLVLRFRVDDLD